VIAGDGAPAPRVTTTWSAIHNQLGNIYDQAGDTGQALSHYQITIRYRERQDDRYRAGRTRYNAAIALASAGRRADDLLYARAAASATSRPSGPAPPPKPTRHASSSPSSKENRPMTPAPPGMLPRSLGPVPAAGFAWERKARSTVW
jgi:hypothetical protein